MFSATIDTLAELRDPAVPGALKEALIDKIACEAKVQLLCEKPALRPLEGTRLKELKLELRTLEDRLESERSGFRTAKLECEAFFAAFDRQVVSVQ